MHKKSVSAPEDSSSAGQSYGPEEIYRRISYYCSYQERSRKEVLEKLSELGLPGEAGERVLQRLVQENFQDENRYATRFAEGHLRLKNWGKMKIKQGLRRKGVGETQVRHALAGLDKAEYQKILEKQLTIKWRSLQKEKNPLAKKAKARNFLLQRGFESALIQASLRALE
jgi:regulatory protein